MDHILDNMIWNAITTGNKDIAIIKGCWLLFAGYCSVRGDESL
jgi:hypothetical protein